MSVRKIAVDARMIKNSGIGTVLSNVLARWIQSDRETCFYLLGDPAVLERFHWAHGECVEIVPCKVPIYSVREQFVLPRVIPAGADLLWVPHYNIPIFYRGRLLVTVHDVFHLDMAHLVPGLHRRLYAKFMFAAVAARADKIICVSQFTEKRLRYFEPGLQEQKTCVIYNGVDDYWKHPSFHQESLHRPYLLFVGNVKPHKNLPRLVAAFSEIKDKIPHDLVIVGKEEGFIVGDNKVKKIADSLKERIRFTGYISDEELRSLYAGAALFVFPTLYEGFGLPPLEAVAAGCRSLLLSDIPVLHEIYGTSAIYADPYDEVALAEGIITAVSAAPMAESLAIRLVNRFSWQAAADEIKAVAEACALGCVDELT